MSTYGGTVHLMKMIGRKGKPFCGNCCSDYKQGHGRRRKRIGKRVEKARERRQWRAEARDA